jgi:hypothetical protein
LDGDTQCAIANHQPAMPISLHDEIPDSRFGFFLLQTHVVTEAGHGPAAIRLTVEDLSSGQKLVFASVVEFSRFLNRLAEPTGNDRWAPPAGA